MVDVLNFWSGRRVLITGHTGFKGAWLTYWLKSLGADVTGIALDPITKPNLYDALELFNFCDSYIHDIRDLNFLISVIDKKKPDILFHLAAQPLVRFGYDNPVETFDVNLTGTLSVLESLRITKLPKVAIMVTTDKVYKNIENKQPFVETDQLGGIDPYSASKAGSELIINAYQKSFLSKNGIEIGVARAGNVIGGGDWSQDRLIPDAIRAWSAGEPLYVRNPGAVRPWQHVLDSLAGYMVLAENIWHDPLKSGSYNFGPNNSDVATVQNVLEILKSGFETNAIVGPEKKSDQNTYIESHTLLLNSSKANEHLNFRTVWGLNETIEKTSIWYKRFFEGVLARKLCSDDIDSYEKKFRMAR